MVLFNFHQVKAIIVRLSPENHEDFDAELETVLVDLRIAHLLTVYKFLILSPL